MINTTKHVRWLLNDSSIRWGLLISLLLVLLQWILFGIYGWRLQPEIPMFFSLPQGKAQLVDKAWFVLHPILGLVILTINTLIIRLQQNYYRIYCQLLTWITMIIICMITIAMIHKIWLVY